MHSAKRLMGVLAGAAAMALVCGAALWIAPGGRTALAASGLESKSGETREKGDDKAGDKAGDKTQERITIDYPLEGSIFPPDITSPTILWHDPSQAATRWVVEVSFAGQSANGAQKMRVETAGELMQRGKIDPEAGPGLELTPEQASTHTWKPDAYGEAPGLVLDHRIRGLDPVVEGEGVDKGLQRRAR